MFHQNPKSTSMLFDSLKRLFSSLSHTIQTMKLRININSLSNVELIFLKILAVF